MLNCQKMWIYEYWNAVSVSHTVALLPVTPPSMIPPPHYVKAIWHVMSIWFVQMWRCQWCAEIADDWAGMCAGTSAVSRRLVQPWYQKWQGRCVKSNWKVFRFFSTCSIPTLFGTAVVGNNPKTEILSESIYIISDDAVLKMIRYTDTCRLLSLCLSQPVKQCRVMNNNAGKLFHYRITVSPPTNFLVSLFFLLRTPK